MRGITTLILLLTTLQIFGQSFEGTLVYKVDFEFHISDKMAKMGVTNEMLKERMIREGSSTDSLKMCFKQGDYISYTNFNPQSWSIYKQQNNKLYSFQNGEASDICTVTDVSFDSEFQLTGIKPTITKLDTLVVINGIKCEIVRVKWKSGTYDYYFNSTFLKVDNKLFENHHYDGWAEFLAISNSLPVKIVKTVKGLTVVTLTLIRNKAETIDSNLFLIPTLIEDKDLNIMKFTNRELFRIK